MNYYDYGYDYMDYRTALNNNKMNVFNAKDAFTNGTIFKTLYIPYKNYLPKQPSSMTEKGRLMLEVQMYCAASHDLALYLDVFPNDKNVVSLRREYSEKYKRALKEYESKYGAITKTSDTLYTVPYNWSVNAWPWEGNK